MIPNALDILGRLIAFDTTSHRSNLALIDWVEAHLAMRGIPCWRVAGADGAKANLLARIGPDVAGGIVLSGHSDVVPVEGQSWTSDPWTMTRRGDRLYGRGVADMKGFIALALALADTPAAQRLTRPIIIAITYDEEIGCLGAPLLIGRLGDHVAPPALAVIGEPTSMKIVSVHKGMRVFEVTVRGREAHSSQRGQGASAIAAALPLMRLVGEMDGEARAAIRAGDLCHPPGATMTVGVVEGGTAANIVPGQCRFRWDLRTTVAADADRYEARFRAAADAANAAIRALAPEGGVAVERLADAPPLEFDQGGEAERFVRALTGDNDAIGAAFTAEAGLYQQAGIPAVLCGPGSIEQAHQPDEWIAIDQIERGAEFLLRLAGRLSA
ncbi:MAG: acetylornithine deacetylase [Sphingomonas fennica]